MTELSLYSRLKSYDVISLLWPLLESKSFRARISDGKLEPVLEGIQPNTPWIHTNENDLKFHCRLWSNISFQIVSVNLPVQYRFVPRGCQGCWKVVIKPDTLEQLFAILEIQQSLDLTSKCGIEERDTVPYLYGAYFYNRSLDEGLECYETIKNKLLKDKTLTPLIDDVDEDGRTKRIILKRGCTEFEHTIGPSDQWEITETQNVLEDVIEEYVALDPSEGGQPEHIVNHIICRWIEWAAGNKDLTYLKYTDGPLSPDVSTTKRTKHYIPDYITYHQPELIERRA